MAATAHNGIIWIQSCSAESDAAIWSVYQQSVRRHAAKVVRPGWQAEFHGVSITYPGIDYVDSAVHLATREVVRNAIEAEQAGYAGFAFISTSDAGNREVRELTDMPAAFIMETAVHTAAQLGGKFAHLTHNPGSLRKVESLAVERFGQGDRMAAGASVDLTYRDFAGLYREPAPVLAAFEREARAAIARGATVLIPAGGPLSMFFVDHGFRQVDGVPILDILAVVLKETERMIDLNALGLPRRSANFVTAEQKEKLRALFLAR